MDFRLDELYKNLGKQMKTEALMQCFWIDTTFIETSKYYIAVSNHNSAREEKMEIKSSTRF